MAGEWARQRLDFDTALIMTPHKGNAEHLAGMLREVGAFTAIKWARSNTASWTLAETLQPTLFFLEQSGPGIDGAAFTKTLRESGLPYARAPVIMLNEHATVASMREAQNAGAHEYLVHPYSVRHLTRRLDAICSPREWIEAAAYSGPNRRRFNSAALPATRRRTADEGVSD